MAGAVIARRVTMDHITIDGFKIQATHGHYEHERHVEQEFVVSLRVGYDMHKAAGSDALADTIDYDDLRTIIQDIFNGKSHYLIEALAEEIAQQILEKTPAQEVTVSIQKTAAWPNGVPGVSITRHT